MRQIRAGLLLSVPVLFFLFVVTDSNDVLVMMTGATLASILTIAR